MTRGLDGLVVCNPMNGHKGKVQSLNQPEPIHEMPLVMMCGFPASGKSTYTNQLRQYIEQEKSINVSVIGESDQKWNKNDVYDDPHQEKELRGALKSSVQRKISKDDVIILDSLNYIKGYRYELYCVSKASQTPQCVIHCAISEQLAAEWNKQRPTEDQYSQEILNGLVMRFELPDSRNRWDSPLFTVNPGDDLPCRQICEALFNCKPPPPNQATLSQPLSATNFLHELDKTTQSIVSCILEAQKTSVPGESIAILGATDKIDLPKNMTLGELQRLRRQFITFTKSHPVEGTSKITNTFVQFINSTMR